MDHIEFSRASADGLTLFYRAWQPEGTPRAVVCLVHGLGEHSGRYGHVAAAMTAAGYALLACDLRGHGQSGGARGGTPSYDALMGDIDALLAEAATRYPGLPRFLYGHSLGGGLVLNYALRRGPNLAGVIATSPWLRLPFNPPALQMRLARLMDRIYPSFTMANGLDLEGLSHDPAVVRDYKADPLVHDRISARLALCMMDAGEWALAHAAEFSLPLLLVHGGADRLTSARASQEFAQAATCDCTLKLWDGLYHETHNEPQKDEVIGFTIDWLHAHLPAAEAAESAGATADHGPVAGPSS